MTLQTRLIFSLFFLLPIVNRPGEGVVFPEIRGWTRTADSASYDVTNLWNVIDGAAESFILYGFRSLTIGEYASVEGCTVRVEIYSHDSPTMAFGIYTTERQPEYSWVTVGTEGYIEEGVLNFLAGKYYCKLTSHERGTRAREGLLEIGRAFDASLGGSRAWPEGLNHLPTEGRVAHSEGFIPSEVLGYSFLKEAFVASYGGGVRLYTIREETPAAARALAERYASLTSAREDPDRTWQIADPNTGKVLLLLRARILYVIVDATPADAVKLTRAVDCIAD